LNEKAKEIWEAGERALRVITSERRLFYEKRAKWQANPEWEIPKLSPLWENVW